MKKGFSIAEAMVMLLIVSLALAAWAPLLSRKMKYQTENIKEIDTKIDVPIGAIMFFHPGVTNYVKTSSSNPCPPGWKQLPVNFNDRFIRITDGRMGSRNFGTYQEDAFKEHSHVVPWGEHYGFQSRASADEDYPWGYYTEDLNGGTPNTNVGLSSSRGRDYDNTWMYASPPALRQQVSQTNGYIAKFLTGTDYQETRPKNIALLACVKGNMPDNYTPESNFISNEVIGDVPK